MLLNPDVQVISLHLTGINTSVQCRSFFGDSFDFLFGLLNSSGPLFDRITFSLIVERSVAILRKGVQLVKDIKLQKAVKNFFALRGLVVDESVEVSLARKSSEQEIFRSTN